VWQEASTLLHSAQAEPLHFDAPAALASLAGRWLARWPGSAVPSASACLTVAATREALLEALSLKLSNEGRGESWRVRGHSSQLDTLSDAFHAMQGTSHLRLHTRKRIRACTVQGTLCSMASHVRSAQRHLPRISTGPQMWTRQRQLLRVQEVKRLRGEVALGCACALERQGFADAAQELLTFAKAALPRGALSEAQLRVSLAQARRPCMHASRQSPSASLSADPAFLPDNVLSFGSGNPAIDASVSISLLCNFTVPASPHFAFRMSMHSYPSRMRALSGVQVHNTPSSAPLHQALQASLRDMLRAPPHAGPAAAGSAAASTAMTRRRILEGDAKRVLAQSGANAEAEAGPSSPVARGLLSEALVAYAAAAGVGPHGSAQGSAGAAAPGAEGAAEAAQAALRLALLCSSLLRVRPVRPTRAARAASSLQARVPLPLMCCTLSCILAVLAVQVLHTCRSSAAVTVHTLAGHGTSPLRVPCRTRQTARRPEPQGP